MEGVESSQQSERELCALTTPNKEAEQASNESKQGGWITFPFITGTHFGLSLVAGGWASNLIVYLITKYNVKSITATKISNVVQGSNCLFPVAGAIIADSFLGSFLVVAFFAFVSLLGMIMFTITATIHSLRPPGCAVGSHTCETPSNLQYGVLYVTLLLNSLGVGGTRFTIATMGAGQFDEPNDQATFFNWYFFALYFASAIGFTAIVYTQDNVSWGLGFGICVIANAISFVLFVLGKRFYRQVKPNGSPFTSIARVMVAAIRKRKMLETFRRQDYYFEFTGASNMEDNLPTKSFRFLNVAALKTEGNRQLNGLNARSWKLCTVEEVEDLKTLIRIIPLWSTGIFLSISIGIFSSLVTLQALTMDRHLGPQFQIPAGSFLIFNILATAISILIIDRFLLPTWRNPARQTLTPLQRIGIGHIINMFGLVGAALIESKRLHVARTHHLMGQPGLVVSMSALWLVVPLGILGIGEGFHFPGSVGLYYQEFPKSLKSTSTAMVSLLLAIGLYLSPAITSLVDRITGWLPNNINDGRLDNVYWMLVVMAVVNFGYFLICAKMFKYQNVEDHNGPSGQAP